MSGHDFLVPPRSWKEIKQETIRFRRQFRLQDDPEFPIMEILEKILDQQLNIVRIEIGSRDEMGRTEGQTDPGGEFIELREDVYAAAWRGNGRARFTAAHELGHFILHTNRTLARTNQSSRHKAFQLSEPQANHFAAELLMPPEFFDGNDSEQDVVDRHRVSYEAARNRLDYLEKKGFL